MPSIPCMGLMKHSYEFSKNCHTIFRVLRHFRWKKELDLTLYMRTISLITSDICLKKLQM